MSTHNITTYQNAEPIRDIDPFANGSRQARRGDKPVCLSNEPAGDWWWHLDDGHLDVGPFISEYAALTDCLESISRAGMMISEKGMINCADRLGFYMKPLAGGRYRLTWYRDASFCELESLQAVIDYFTDSAKVLA